MDETKTLADYIYEGTLPIELISQELINKYAIKVGDKTPFTGLKIISIGV